jgi:hypothetical protein
MDGLFRGHSLDTLFLQGRCKRRRVSSYDRTGGNMDWLTLAPGGRAVFANIEGCGVVRHLWCTVGGGDELYPRKAVLRFYWDGEASPSVEAPIGDFFGIGHGIVKNFTSEPLQMSPQVGRGFNCFFPMPFQKSARFELENQCEKEISFYFYVDYEAYEACDALGPEVAYFHSQWRREADTKGWADPAVKIKDDLARQPGLPDWYPRVWTAANKDGRDNYVILEAQGKGHYVGCNLNVDCFARQANDWYGEGDDMIFIDGDPLPTLHGTGTEDYFNTAFGPHQEACAPWQGITVYSGTEDWPFRGKNSMYRFHIKDPVYFDQSIRVTIEHGHGNKLSNDYSSTAYWYQSEPHAPFPALPPVGERLPRG